MLLQLQNIFSPSELAQVREILKCATWADGKKTAGPQAVMAKHNQQLPEAAEETTRLRELVLLGLEKNPLFFSASLPKHISPPMFNRYGGSANRYDNHVDSAVRFLPNGQGRVRTDISCTLFLSDPEDYAGGELTIEDTYGPHSVKLAAGDMILYPGTSVHRVNPVSAGERIACFFWIQSMVRRDDQRTLLFDMDKHLRHLRQTLGEQHASVIGLTGSYHNLLRMWADT